MYFDVHCSKSCKVEKFQVYHKCYVKLTLNFPKKFVIIILTNQNLVKLYLVKYDLKYNKNILVICCENHFISVCKNI